MVVIGSDTLDYNYKHFSFDDPSPEGPMSIQFIVVPRDVYKGVQENQEDDELKQKVVFLPNHTEEKISSTVIRSMDRTTLTESKKAHRMIDQDVINYYSELKNKSRCRKKYVI